MDDEILLRSLVVVPVATLLPLSLLRVPSPPVRT